MPPFSLFPNWDCKDRQLSDFSKFISKILPKKKPGAIYPRAYSYENYQSPLFYHYLTNGFFTTAIAQSGNIQARR